jgi:hypothetical protein
MSPIDPTGTLGDGSADPLTEYSVEDVARALGNGGVATIAEVEAAPAVDRIPIPRVVDEAMVLEADATGASRLGTLPPVLPTPIPIVPITRLVSGRYRNTGALELELRVDVDGKRPLRRFSGDFFNRSGATLSYFGSFIVNSPTVTITSTQVVMDGMGSFTWAAGAPRVRVTIPRVSIFGPAPAATVRFMTAGGSPGASYTCPFGSGFFRTVQYEEDRVAGVTPFVSYNTGALTSPPPARTLTVPGAYAEAGIELVPAGIRNVVPTAGIGPSWSNAELHAAMVANFSLWVNTPQWRVWMLTAMLHDLGPGLLGIMFDQHGPQRQGCAVFHAGLAGTSAAKQREQLFTVVHELGHCFNLYHSFHKQYMNPPQPNRLMSLSWMNYPWNYPTGQANFWANFPFQFDDLELVHLRHAFRNNIIMGGNPFGTGAALEHTEAFADPIADDSGLRLEVRGRSSFALGEPVVVEMKLETYDLRGKEVTANLHPDFGFVHIGIRHPSGVVRAFEPMIDHCIVPGTARLTRERPAIYESAYIGYGKDGLYFDAPGMYEIRAVYHAPDGSRVVSNVHTLRVRSPITQADDEVADLLLGEEQGQLFVLLGSDSDALEDGNEALETLATKHDKHPLSVYAHLVQGVNAQRQFKEITADGRIQARDPDLDDSIKDLKKVVKASKEGRGLDNISLNMAMRTLADAQEAKGETDAAVATANDMLGHFKRQGLQRFVLAAIEEQVEAYEPGEQYLPAAERRARSNHLDATQAS